MNLEQLSYLITNVTAITQQVFTIQCGEFATALANDESNELEVSDFDLVSHFSSFDFQSMLDSGYKDKDDMTEIFSGIAERIDEAELISIIDTLPPGLPQLAKKLNPDQLKAWIEYALGANNQSPIYQLHQMFSGGSGADEEPLSDLIRQAIAFDDLAELDGVTQVSPADITLDDIGTAVTIQSFQVLEWMLKHASLTEGDMLELCAQQKDDPALLSQLVNHLRPYIVSLDVIREGAKSLGLSEVYEALRAVK